MSRKAGDKAEKIARQYLEKKGLKFVAKNYCIKNGEIDLIMRDRDFLVFIEVKMRNHEAYGNALEMVTSNKQKCIIRTAQHYLQSHKLTDCEYIRFDVVGIIQNRQQITWIQNAFEVQY